MRHHVFVRKLVGEPDRASVRRVVHKVHRFFAVHPETGVVEKSPFRAVEMDRVVADVRAALAAAIVLVDRCGIGVFLADLPIQMSVEAAAAVLAFDGGVPFGTE